MRGIDRLGSPVDEAPPVIPRDQKRVAYIIMNMDI